MVSKEEFREKIINKIIEKNPSLTDKAEMIADSIVSRPYINEGTYEVFLETAGLL
jgi:hypothetical protein